MCHALAKNKNRRPGFPRQQIFVAGRDAGASEFGGNNGWQ
jgi:hypothetical protein